MKGLHQKPRSNRSKTFLHVILILAIVLLLALMLCKCGLKDSEELPQIDVAQDTVEKNPSSIAIPGYEVLELQANTKKQTLALSNPAQNICYFQIELYLEDGTLLWKSELIEPGKTSKPITLSKELDKGTYPNAILRYSCFRMDKELSPLNGAQTKLTLWVK